MQPETLTFKTELKQLLHLIVHSLYSHKDIFLRELISNASDALDTARFQSLTQPEILEDNGDWRIQLIPNEADGTLTIRDNGIGMNRETVVENLGTIARSGTRAFLERLKEANASERPELIGQFGVGFYSAFMVADRVTVLSRMAGKPEDGVRWTSDGQGEYQVEAADKLTRGTDVILHLKADDKEFLQTWRLRELVKKYSDFVEHPIVIDVEKEDETKNKSVTQETLNARKAIWLRSKSAVTQEEYIEFYKHLSHDFEPPLKTVHYVAEGQVEFKALLYIPAHRPMDLMWGDSNKGLHLYIQRVFIMDDCEALLPRWLRFVRGVVDSPDLPLNVSREILQQSAPLEKIKGNLVNKLLNTLDELKKNEFDKYVKFYEDLGVFLKEGALQDWTNRAKIADLLLFESTKTDPGKLTSLADYVSRMPGEQTEIFFLAGETRELLEQSPHLEAYRARGQEVLCLIDPADEFVVDNLRDFQGKPFKAINKGVADSAVDAAAKERLQPLLDVFKEKLPDIKDARLTTRLKDSAVCLVADEDEMSANMERLMQRLGREKPKEKAKRILEVNGEHPVVAALARLVAKDRGDARLEGFCKLLYDQALITEGSKVRDPLDFARRVNDLITKNLD